MWKTAFVDENERRLALYVNENFHHRLRNMTECIRGKFPGENQDIYRLHAINAIRANLEWNKRNPQVNHSHHLMFLD